MGRLKTQCQVVLEHLREVGPITQDEARDRYGIARLASRISTLKKTYPEISVRMVKVSTRYGHKAKIAEYFVEKKDVGQADLLDVKPSARW